MILAPGFAEPDAEADATAPPSAFALDDAVRLALGAVLGAVLATVPALLLDAISSHPPPAPLVLGVGAAFGFVSAMLVVTPGSGAASCLHAATIHGDEKRRIATRRERRFFMAKLYSAPAKVSARRGVCPAMYRSSADQPHPGFGANASRYAGAVRSFDVRDLPTATRAYLYECMRGHAVPTPLLAVPTGARVGPRSGSALAIAATMALGVAILFACTASTAPSLALLVTHVGLAVLAAGAIAGALRSRRASPGGGVAAGIYLFPFDLVDARESRIRLYPLASARDVRVRADEGAHAAATLEIEFGDAARAESHGPTLSLATRAGTTFALAVNDRAIADDLRAEIVRTIGRIEALANAGDLATVAAYDVFHELREAGSWGDASSVRTVPRVSSRGGRVFVAVAAWAAALGVGAGVGAASFSYSKTTNDDLRFARANSRGTIDTYAQYLVSGGGRYEAEVLRTRLPCAELRIALLRTPSLHDTKPLATFVKRYPASYCTDTAKLALSQHVEGVRVAFVR